MSRSMTMKKWISDEWKWKSKKIFLCLCCMQAAGHCYKWQIIPSEVLIRFFFRFNRQRTTRNECCIFQLKIPYTAYLTLLFRLGCCFRIFGPWSCRRRWLIYRWWWRWFRWCVISLLFFILHLLMLITFNRWFYWWWWYTYRSWVGDPTTYVVEYPAKWRWPRWFINRNLRTISVSQDETHRRGYFWSYSSPAWSWQIFPLAYRM